MERKLGEIFTHNGKIYQVVKGFSCKGCAFIKNGCCDLVNELLGPCDYTKRTDKTNVIFKEINNMEIKNNLEILKIDLVNSDEAFARHYNEDRNIFSCKVYITLEDLDFEVDSVFWHDDVLGTVKIKILKNQYGLCLGEMKMVLGGEPLIKNVKILKKL